MEDSILKSTKKILGLAPDYDAFDLDILTHINSAFSTLHQLGLGPAEGLFISDDVPKWSAFLGDDPRINSVRSYVYLKVRILFDPPQTSYLLAAQENQIKELEWRLTLVKDGDNWVDPNPEVDDGE